MGSPISKEGSSNIKVVVISGLFTLLAACISGAFVLLNTMLENSNVTISSTVSQTQTASTVTLTAEQAPQISPSSTTDVHSAIPSPADTSMLFITDKTNDITYGFKIGEAAGSSQNCPGAYLETGSAQITYDINVPPLWSVIIDSWQAEWDSGSYQNDGFLIITGEWEGTVKINTGAICGISVEQAQTVLQYRKSVTGFDARPEYSIP